jgi:hypothetical protein
MVKEAVARSLRYQTTLKPAQAWFTQVKNHGPGSKNGRKEMKI